jgi:proteasome lid subunit RPN8/RPN11
VKEADVLTGASSRTVRACLAGARGAEICGYLVEDAEGARDFVAVENRLASPDACFVSAADDARARRAIASRSLRIVAWVHSHADGLELSPVDREWLARGRLPWVVVCLCAGELRFRCYDPPDRDQR